MPKLVLLFYFPCNDNIVTSAGCSSYSAKDVTYDFVEFVGRAI